MRSCLCVRRAECKSGFASCVRISRELGRLRVPGVAVRALIRGTMIRNIRGTA